MRDTLSTFLAGELNKGFHGRGAREGDAREPVALETGMSDFAWLGFGFAEICGESKIGFNQRANRKENKRTRGLNRCYH